MRKLIATVFNYSLDGRSPTRAPSSGSFASTCPKTVSRPPGAARLSPERARAHHGPHRLRGHLRSHDNVHHHPFAPILNAAPKVVFSQTLKTADWANTTIAAGDTAAEIDKLRQGGDGHIVVWGGVRIWRSLMQLDLIDELRLSVFPYVAGEGTWLFDGVPKSYALDLVSSAASSNGILELRYRRHR